MVSEQDAIPLQETQKSNIIPTACYVTKNKRKKRKKKIPEIFIFNNPTTRKKNLVLYDLLSISESITCVSKHEEFCLTCTSLRVTSTLQDTCDTIKSSKNKTELFIVQLYTTFVPPSFQPSLVPLFFVPFFHGH